MTVDQNSGTATDDVRNGNLKHDVSTKKNCLDQIAGNVYSKEKTYELRKKLICQANQLFFNENPLKIIRGEGTYMIDENGTAILDCINNVACVGHCHPDVVRAGATQMSLLSTNNRYLHDNILLLAERLVQTFEALNPQLEVCLFVNSGSEANDLALRMSRTHTSASDVMVLDNAYHGHVTSMMEISPYKFKLPGGGGQKRHVHVVEIPNKYNGKFRNDKHSEEEISDLYLQEVKKTVEAATQQGRRISSFFVESVQSCGGQIVYPQNWMRNAFEYCQEQGIVCIADEVQTGFGRTGTHFWSFQSQDVQPDLVVMGKPMGNGHPISCVVTTRDIADSFTRTGVQYFNTFGGNPVSCAIALSVMDVIQKEKLQEKALETGRHLLERLQNELKPRHAIIGDVRGSGLMIGIELVKSRETRQPATAEAAQVKRAMIGRNILLSTDGPHESVLKIKPPMVFGREHADKVVDKLDEVLASIKMEEEELSVSANCSSSSDDGASSH